MDDVSEKDVVKVAVGSPDHTTLVAAVKAADLVTSVLNVDFFRDGQTMGMVDGTNVTFSVNGDEVSVDGAKILGSVKASNGWVHVVDKVILPK